MPDLLQRLESLAAQPDLIQRLGNIATQRQMHGPSVLQEQAFKPFKIDKGTSYPTTQAELDFHRRALWLHRNPNKFVSENCATADMMRQNDTKRRVSRSEFEACERLRTLLRNHKSGHPYGPDLAVKAFKDLDLVFFGGHLNGHVSVNWSGCSKNKGFGCCEASCCYAFTQGTLRTGSGQCRITMNADLIFGSEIKDPFKQMLTTLLHEMCHAVDDVRCGIRFKGDEPHGGHHEHFGTRISVVHELSLRLLGWGAVMENEPYMQHHWFKGSEAHGPSIRCGGESRRDGGGNHGHKHHGGHGVTRADQEVDAPMRTNKIDGKTGHKELRAREDRHMQNREPDERHGRGERRECGERQARERDGDRDRREGHKQGREPDKKDGRAERREDRHKHDGKPNEKKERGKRREDGEKKHHGHDEKSGRGERRQGGQRQGRERNEKDAQADRQVGDQKKR